MAKHPLHKMIAPRQLLAHIRSAVPYRFPAPKDMPRIQGSLAAKASAPLGWWDIIHSAKNFQISKNPNAQEFVDYFALCLAAHHCTVASYVPTDVDTKIRKHIWHYASAPGIIKRMCQVLIDAISIWDRQTVAARSITDEQEGAVSGLDGEWLSVLIPAMCSAHKQGLDELSDQLWDMILNEIKREGRMFLKYFQSKDTTTLLKLSAILSHNAGDIDQGIEHAASSPAMQERLNQIKRLAHENDGPFDGAFALAADIYKACMAKEFHRHYPLREITHLRQHPDFAFPMSPFLDQWGACLATHPALDYDQRLEILGGLIHACDVVANQVGYYRAISGFVRAIDDDDFLMHLPVNLLTRLKESDIQDQIDIDEAGFEAHMSKQVYDTIPKLNPERVQFYLEQ